MAETQNNEREAFAQRLMRQRSDLGMSRAQLAARVGCSVPTIWAWETGRVEPRAKSLRALVKTLDLPGRDDSTSRQTSSDPTLVALIAESRDVIARSAGIDREQVKIILEF